MIPRYLIIWTDPGDDKMYDSQFFNRYDVDSWLENNQDKRAIVLYGNFVIEEYQ